MKISVILCTCNRGANLAKTLESLAGSVLPPAVEWEVLVVDNNSTDQTRAVTEDLCRQFPGRFRYLFEPHPGKSYALNAGIREARGDVLAFTDDDVTVDPAWLRNLTASLNDGQWAGSGGRTLPSEPFSPPDWMTTEGYDNLLPILCAHFDRGDKAHQLECAPYGVNMAFRKEIFQKHGPFRVDLGPSPYPEIPRPREDTEFGRRLLAAGERLHYEPFAIVYHPIHPNRVSKQYILGLSFDDGRAAIVERGKRPEIWGIPRCYFSIPKGTLLLLPKVVRWMLALETKRRFLLKVKVWFFAGQIVEIYRQARRKDPAT